MRRLAIALGLALNCAGHAQAQTHPNTANPTVSAGTWYFAIRAFNSAGLQSGYSNVVRVDCAPVAPATTCPVLLTWDRNAEGDLAGYVLVWGAASGVYTQSQTIPVTLTGGTRLPTPTLRIRR